MSGPTVGDTIEDGNAPLSAHCQDVVPQRQARTETGHLCIPRAYRGLLHPSFGSALVRVDCSARCVRCADYQESGAQHNICAAALGGVERECDLQRPRGSFAAEDVDRAF